MSKWYEVSVKTTVTLLVETEDDGEVYGDSYNEAIEVATGEFADFEDVEAVVVPDDRLESYRKDLQLSRIFRL